MNSFNNKYRKYTHTLSPFHSFHYERDKVKSTTAMLAHIFEPSITCLYTTDYITFLNICSNTEISSLQPT